MSQIPSRQLWYQIQSVIIQLRAASIWETVYHPVETAHFRFQHPQTQAILVLEKSGCLDLGAVMLFRNNHTASRLVCTGLAFSPAGAIGTMDRDTVIFALQGSGHHCPSFGA